MDTAWSKLKVVDLRAELKKRGLNQNGLKQDLVSRLAAADEERGEGGGEEGGEEDGGDEKPPVVDSPVEGAASLAEDRQTVSAQAPLEPAEASMDEESEPTTVEPSQSTTSNCETKNSGASEITRVPSSEVAVDEKKRKRRSRSPPPSVHDTPRKRQRQTSDEPLQVGQADGQTKTVAARDTPIKSETRATEQTPVPKQVLDAPLESIEPSKPSTVLEAQEVQAMPSSAADVGNASAQKMEQDDVVDYGADSPPATHAGLEPEPKAEPEPMQVDSRLDDKIRGGTVPTGPRNVGSARVDEEADPVSPALHRATNSLYIGNIMRPLKPDHLQDHIVDLAAGRGPPDPSIITAFWLDTIRTHALVQFKTISAASRVRSALHDKVWPNERERKALWVDFVPSKDALDWIAKEQAETDQKGGGGRRGAASRWEVVYHTKDGVMTAVHQEAIGDAKSTSMAPPPVPAASRSQPSSIPTGPANPYPGIEAAPLGPRSMGGGGRGGGDYQMGSASTDRTRAAPSISWRAVSFELARRRLDNLQSYVSREPNRDVGRDHNRYSFTHSDHFIDRGPEMFVGIRPPHRERERNRFAPEGPSGSSGGAPAAAAGPAASGGPGSYRAPVWEPPPMPPRGGRRRRGGGGGGGGGGNRGFGNGGRFGDGRPPRYEDFRYRPGREDSYRSDRR